MAETEGAEDRANLCREEGLLVGMSKAMPAFDIAWVEANDAVPCCKVRCAACGAIVRHIDGYGMRPDQFRKPAHYGALYEEIANKAPEELVMTATGERRLTRAGSGASSRVYVCQCDGCTVPGAIVLSTNGPDSWTCAGHRFAQGFEPN